MDTTFNTSIREQLAHRSPEVLLPVWDLIEVALANGIGPASRGFGGAAFMTLLDDADGTPYQHPADQTLGELFVELSLHLTRAACEDEDDTDQE